jgi:hypothetical protein
MSNVAVSIQYTAKFKGLSQNVTLTEWRDFSVPDTETQTLNSAVALVYPTAVELTISNWILQNTLAATMGAI